LVHGQLHVWGDRASAYRSITVRPLMAGSAGHDQTAVGIIILDDGYSALPTRAQRLLATPGITCCAAQAVPLKDE
jgi:hypothetical protein